LNKRYPDTGAAVVPATADHAASREVPEEVFTFIVNPVGATGVVTPVCDVLVTVESPEALVV
jgi:hypothetical protein